MIKVSGPCYQSIRAAHLSDQFDLRDNMVRFHLIPRFDLENCIESEIVPNPQAEAPEIGSAASCPRGSTPWPGLRRRAWQGDRA